jgi:hypothetical protein
MTRRAFWVALALLLAAATADAQRGGRWERLGEREVSDKADHDRIMAAGQGTFTAIRIDVLRRAVDFQRVVIHFANGADQRVELRSAIPAGGSSRVIDVEGRDRVIRSVEFWYDAKTLGRGVTATVRLMGRN